MSDDYHPLQNVYELRCKGLNEKLTNDELTAAICILQNIEVVLLKRLKKMQKKWRRIELKGYFAAHNEQLIKQGKYICQIQLDNLNNKDHIRGHENNFSAKDYVNELNEILQHRNWMNN